MRLWIDTDIGSDVDDALALAYALRHPAIELVGVSTVFGDVELRREIAERLLLLAGVRDLEVHAGLGKPLTTGRVGLMFGHEGRGLLDQPQPRPTTPENPDETDRVARLAGAIEKASPDVLLAIGPLTNVAAVLRAGSRLPRLAIMGGKTEDVLLPGMIEQIPEWNWYCDPEAVAEVLAAAHERLPLLVPAEVSFGTRLHDEDLQRLSGGDELSRMLAVLAGIWLGFLRERSGGQEPHVALHDPLTAAVLVEETLCGFREKRIRTDDRAASECLEGEPNLRVATGVDNDRLRAHLMEAWLS